MPEGRFNESVRSAQKKTQKHPKEFPSTINSINSSYVYKTAPFPIITPVISSNSFSAFSKAIIDGRHVTWSERNIRAELAGFFPCLPATLSSGNLLLFEVRPWNIDRQMDWFWWPPNGLIKFRGDCTRMKIAHSEVGISFAVAELDCFRSGYPILVFYGRSPLGCRWKVMSPTRRLLPGKWTRR